MGCARSVSSDPGEGASSSVAVQLPFAAFSRLAGGKTSPLLHLSCLVRIDSPRSALGLLRRTAKLSQPWRGNIP